MGEPWFKMRDTCRDNGVRVFSSNYALYGSMSNRVAAYEAAPEEGDECVARTYGPPLEVLIAWTEPALTRKGALEALRLAKQELDVALVDVSTPMVRAALAFFEEAA